jgi:hypothetical protein
MFKDLYYNNRGYFPVNIKNRVKGVATRYAWVHPTRVLLLAARHRLQQPEGKIHRQDGRRRHLLPKENGK